MKFNFRLPTAAVFFFSSTLKMTFDDKKPWPFDGFWAQILNIIFPAKFDV